MYNKILVPVVFDKGHDTKASFQAAQALANEGAEFTVLHVMEAIPSFVESQIPADVLEESRNEIERLLKQSAADLPGSTTALHAGHAGRFIVDYANDNDFDCIVLASHTPGLENLFLGSTADRVVRHAKCTVHVSR